MRRAAQRGLIKEDEDDDHISTKGAPLARRRVVKRRKMRDGFKLGFGSIAVLLCLRPTIQALFPSRGGGAVDGGHYLRGGDGSSPLGADLLWIHPDSQPFVSFVYFTPRHTIEKEFCRLGARSLIPIPPSLVTNRTIYQTIPERTFRHLPRHPSDNCRWSLGADIRERSECGIRRFRLVLV